jgi:hypothetical protein
MKFGLIGEPLPKKSLELLAATREVFPSLWWVTQVANEGGL